MHEEIDDHQHHHWYTQQPSNNILAHQTSPFRNPSSEHQDSKRTDPSLARQLLNANIVVDSLHACDAARNLGGFIGLVPGRGRASQRYYALGGVDTDIAAAHLLVGNNLQLHFGGDPRVVDVRSGFLSCIGATGQAQEDDARLLLLKLGSQQSRGRRPRRHCRPI